MTSAFDRLCSQAGIIWRYKDGAGMNRTAPKQTRQAILAAMGMGADSEDDARARLNDLQDEQSRLAVPWWLVVDAGKPVHVDIAHGCEWRLTLESGETRDGVSTGAIVMGGLPVGYHSLTVDGMPTTILCAPDKLPPPPRCWGITLPLYGLKPGGVGDYSDLAEAADVLGKHGAAFAGINPVHAGFPEDPAAISPYSPSSRRRFNTAHITTGEPSPSDFGLIDYPTALRAHKASLRRLFEADNNSASLDKFIAKEGSALRNFAIHQAISEQYGAYWKDWPAKLRNADSADVEQFAKANSQAVRFHSWAQMMAESQLRFAAESASKAKMSLGLYLDLAVGTHPYGAETWTDRELFASNISLGAPPDPFSSSGQVWGLAPIIPQQLEKSAFTPFAETLRKQLVYAGLLRIDHILGFDRAYWVPDGMPGAYVRMPRKAMLAVTRIEAHRASAMVIGEDLGNVPKGLRADLARSGVLGCRVAMFERHWNTDRSFLEPEQYKPPSIASFSTHDLPTWAGWRKGTDIDWNGKLGRMTAVETQQAQTGRRADVKAFDRLTSGADFSHLCRFLGCTGSRLVALQIEDILGLEHQPNLPGTIDEYPNWRRRLPVRIADLAEDPRLSSAAKLMAEAGR